MAGSPRTRPSDMTIKKEVAICQVVTCNIVATKDILQLAMTDSRHVPQLCPNFHHASELIGRRWSGAIIYVLLKSRCRFATLREAIPDITDRMLSERLQ